MLPTPARRLTGQSDARTSLRALLLARWPLLVLTGIVGLAVAARLYDVTENPRGFFTDEASFGFNADRILYTLRDEHGAFMPVLFKSFGEYKLPAYIYAEVPFIAIFGRTEFAVRLTSVVAGSLTVATTYLLAKQIFRQELPALAAAATLAVLPWHIHYSRTGLGDIVMLPLFFTAGSYLFFRATKDQRFLIPAAIVMAATFYTYRGGWVTLPPLLLIMAVAYRQELLRSPRELSIAVVTGGLVLLPLAYHLVFGDSDRTTQAWIFNIEGDQSTWQLFTDFYRSYFTESFLFSHGDNGPITRHYLPHHGQIYYLQIPLLFAGAAWLLWRFSRRGLFVLALMLLFPLSAAVSDTSPISSRAIMGSVAFSLLTGAGLRAIVSAITAFVPAQRPLLGAAIVLVFAVGGAYSFGRYAERYHSQYPSLSAGYWGWQDGPEEIISYFLSVESGYDQLVMDGSFNAPSMFFRFYAEGRCGKCIVGDAHRYEDSKRQLFALRPEHLVSEFDYRPQHTLHYPDGSISFVLTEIAGRR